MEHKSAIKGMLYGEYVNFSYHKQKYLLWILLPQTIICGSHIYSTFFFDNIYSTFTQKNFVNLEDIALLNKCIHPYITSINQ